MRERPLNTPGESQTEHFYHDVVLGRALWWGMVVAMLSGFAIGAWTQWLMQTPPSLGGAIVVSIFALASWGWYGLFALPEFRRQRDRLWLGIDGEKLVAQRLDELRSLGYHAIHDIPGDGFNIDHVLVGPTGVYVIETKARSKRPERRNVTVSYDGQRVLVDGHAPDRDPLQQVEANAKHIREFLRSRIDLDPHIRPVVLFPGWFVEKQPRGVNTWVLNEKAFVTFVQNEPKRLADGDVQRIHTSLADHVRSTAR